MVAQGVETQVMEITPEIAEVFLKANKLNRRLDLPRVTEMAKAMEEGRFPFNGDAIRFNVLGNLIDGQHRLKAIIQAGVPIKQVVVTGLSEAAMSTIDQPRVRSVGDILKLRGNNVLNVAATASTTTILTTLEFGQSYGRDKVRQTEYIENHYDELSPWVQYAGVVSKDSPILSSRTLGHRAVRSMSQSVVAALSIHMVRQGADPQTVRDFFSGVAKGFNLPVEKLTKLSPERLSVLQALHKRLLGGTPLSRVSGGSAIVGLLGEYAIYITAYNRYVENLPMRLARGFKDSPKTLKDLPTVNPNAVEG